jgi:hypothetical protein
MRSSAALLGVLLVPFLATAPARAGDGVFGVFFDAAGTNCSGSVPVASFAPLHVVLLPQGSTFGGIMGAEFSVTAAQNASFLLQGESVEAGAIQIGAALNGGATIGFANCHAGSAIPVLSFQVINLGGSASDVEVRVAAKSSPSNPLLQCPLAVLCDEPQFTAICVSGTRGILNPSGDAPCGAGRRAASWEHVKDMYR